MQTPVAPDADDPRETIAAWLEAEGWTVEERRRAARCRDGEDGFLWSLVVARDSMRLVLAEPALRPERLVLCQRFELAPSDQAQLDVLSFPARTQLAWDLLSHLNLLQIDYEVDAPVPRELTLTLTAPRETLTRERLLDQVGRLVSALRLIGLAYAKAFGTLVDHLPAATVH